jgi:hypothetical protein
MASSYFATAKRSHEPFKVRPTRDTVDVYLCPKSFLDDMGVSFSTGDEITLTGSKVEQGGAELILPAKS